MAKFAASLTNEFSSGEWISKSEKSTRRQTPQREPSNICPVDLISPRKVRPCDLIPVKLPSEIALNDFHEYEWFERAEGGILHSGPSRRCTRSRLRLEPQSTLIKYFRTKIEIRFVSFTFFCADFYICFED